MHATTTLTRRWVKLAMSLGAITAVAIPAVAISAPAGASPLSGTPSYSCPAVGDDSGCGYLITFNGDASATVTHESGVGPYDNSEDVLVGILNNSDALVSSIEGTDPVDRLLELA